MPKFKDSLSRDWDLQINYHTVRTVRNELKIDLLEVAERPTDNQTSLLQRLASDEMLLVDVISVILTTQIKALGITVEGFAEGMLGEGLENACNALIEGIANFSRPQKGQMIRVAWSKIKSTESLVATRVTKILEDPRLEKRVNAMIDQIEADLDTPLPRSTATFGN